MTKLSYKVGNFETTSYAEAVEMSQKYRVPIEKKYETIKNETSVDTISRALRVAKIRAQARGLY